MDIVQFGWYEDTSQTPTFDPGITGVSCPVCGDELSREPRVTMSVMPEKGNRSLFFRAHKRCWNGIDDAAQMRIIGSIVDPEVAGIQ
jgi:hypothetical protein